MLLPAWLKDTPPGLCPTFYGTGSYKGDLKIRKRVSDILGIEDAILPRHQQRELAENPG
jgi:hypothetical protein